MISRYVSFRPPTHVAVAMVRGPWILSRFAGTWRFQKLTESTTEVSYIYNMRLRPQVFARVFGGIVAWLYERDMRRRLEAFRSWAETEGGSSARLAAVA